jgi:hypothetical protein
MKICKVVKEGVPWIIKTAKYKTKADDLDEVIGLLEVDHLPPCCRDKTDAIDVFIQICVQFICIRLLGLPTHVPRDAVVMCV